MRCKPHELLCQGPLRWTGWLSFAVLITLAGSISSVQAQIGAPCENPRVFNNLPPHGNRMPQRTARPSAGPRGIDEFVENISGQKPDAYIDLVIGQPRIITFKENLGTAEQTVQIAIGDPARLDFDLLGPRQIRIYSEVTGVTDMIIVTPNGEYYLFRVTTLFDLDELNSQLGALFPSASVHVRQLRDHLVVEGQARDTIQVQQILDSIRAYALSVNAQESSTVTIEETEEGAEAPGAGGPEGEDPEGGVPAGSGDRPSEVRYDFAETQVINLIKIADPQQVLLKVRVAELNRTALREIGFSFLNRNGGGAAGLAFINQIIQTDTAAANISGVFRDTEFAYFLNATRDNGIAKILAEPNLVAMSGHQASFLAGGEFPVPVPQQQGQVTVQFREFGIRLGFIPFVMDNEVIRMTVVPEVSVIDNNTAVSIVPGGSAIPGLLTRRANTTVQMREGQTLAIAGLLDLSQNNTTSRVPLVGDVPYLGVLFSDNSANRSERELLVTVSPNLVEAMNPDQVPLMPGDEVYEPNDAEFYLLNRIEGRTGRDFRSTVKWDDPLDFVRIMNLEKRSTHGNIGFSK